MNIPVQMRSVAARDRRPVPGGRAFNAFSGPAFVVCGTRKGVKRYGHEPLHFLVAPLDLDPGSLSWPVKDAQLVMMTMGADKDFVLRLTQALLADGAKLVVQVTDGKASFHLNETQAKEMMNGTD